MRRGLDSFVLDASLALIASAQIMNLSFVCSKMLADQVLAKVKELGYTRYKIIVQV